MLSGNQNENNPGEAENTDEIGFVLPSHEISYNAKKVDGLNPVSYTHLDVYKRQILMYI